MGQRVLEVPHVVLPRPFRGFHKGYKGCQALGQIAWQKPNKHSANFRGSRRLLKALAKEDADPCAWVNTLARFDR